MGLNFFFLSKYPVGLQKACKLWGARGSDRRGGGRANGAEAANVGRVEVFRCAAVPRMEEDMYTIEDLSERHDGGRGLTASEAHGGA